MIAGCWRFVVVAGATLLLSSVSGAATFLVDALPDGIDAAPGDGVCATAVGDCTLRAAIMEANGLPGPDTVMVPAGTFPIERPWPPPEDGGDVTATGDLDVWDDLTIAGAGSAYTEIGPGTADRWDRILDIKAGAVVIRDLALRGAFAGINPCCGESTTGGGIQNSSNLTLERVRVEENGADSGGGGIFTTPGSSLIIRDSRIANNHAYDGGGIISSGATVLIVDSEFAENGASYGSAIGMWGVGGEIVVVRSAIRFHGSGPVLASSGGLMRVEKSLISDNILACCQPLITIDGEILSSTISGNHGGDGIVYGNLTLNGVTVVDNVVSSVWSPSVDAGLVSNSIVARTTVSGQAWVAGLDCGTITSGGHNVIGTGCGEYASMHASDIYGTPESPLDPRLGPLTDNGGATETHALYPDSLALDGGSAATWGQEGACPPLDQRGVPRPIDGNGDGVSLCDIGAFEAAVPCANGFDDDGDGLIDFASDPGCRDAISGARENPKCQDGLDNDGDGKFDFDGGASATGGVGLGPADPQCGGVGWKNKEGPSCGIGVELVGVLLLMRFARRRDRAARIVLN